MFYMYSVCVIIYANKDYYYYYYYYNDVSWTWNKEHKESMKQIRIMMVETPLLQYYDPNKELTIQCDASSIGIGATLLQNKKPICYASKTLRDTKRRYVQIEQDCQAILFS